VPRSVPSSRALRQCIGLFKRLHQNLLHWLNVVFCPFTVETPNGTSIIMSDTALQTDGGDQIVFVALDSSRFEKR
jgi:hypothetical protein